MKGRRSHRLLTISSFVLVTPVWAHTDHATKTAEAPQVLPTKKLKVMGLSGTVGPEGKTLTSDPDLRVWTVLNPETLSSSQGRRVTVRALADKSAGQIVISTVRLKEERTTVKQDDVAFRR